MARPRDGFSLLNKFKVLPLKAAESFILDSVDRLNENWCDVKYLLLNMPWMGYKDEPDFDEEGKPILLRTTPLHLLATGKLPIRLFRDIFVRELFLYVYRFDLNYSDEFGLTHFHVACSYGYRDVVQKFLDRGQDPNLLVRETGDSPLLLALKWRHKEVAEMLLRRGADPNLPNKNGLAPLHVICQTSVDGDLAKFFFKIIDELNQRLQVNVQDKFGDTPLNFAVRNDEEVMLKLLLSRGADPTLVNAAGWTTLDIMFQSLQVKQLRFRQAVLRYQRVQLAGAVQLGEQLWSDTDGVSRIASDNGYGQSSDKKYSGEKRC